MDEILFSALSSIPRCAAPFKSVAPYHSGSPQLPHDARQDCEVGTVRCPIDGLLIVVCAGTMEEQCMYNGRKDCETAGHC